MSKNNLSDHNFSTPMMKQYLNIKKEYEDCMVLFRLGDFYELFLEDAKTASKVLNITLTHRDRGSDGKIPMAGVPYHALNNYLYKLIEAGHKVAVCEQLSEPSKDSKIVERDVVRVVTQGTVLDESSLDEKSNNFVMTLHQHKNNIGVAFADISTGEFYTLETKEENLIDELSKIDFSECILDKDHYENTSLLKSLTNSFKVNTHTHNCYDLSNDNSLDYLKKHFGVETLKGFGIDNEKHIYTSAAFLLSYLKYTQKGRIDHIKRIKPYKNRKYLHLDKATINNLELFNTLRDTESGKSLISTIDHTNTSMGGRMFKNWIYKPLVDKKEILNRQKHITYFIKNKKVRTNITKELKNITDIERLLSKLTTGLGNPKDLISLKENLVRCLNVKKILQDSENEKLVNKIDKNLNKIIKKIEEIIVEDPPFDPKNGGLIKEGIDIDLDQMRNIIKDSKEFIESLEEKEKERTNISTLKVKSNKVFGYYIEVSKANSHLVPEDYTRKQTLVNAERYETKELKKHEKIIFREEEKINAKEYEVFLNLVQYIVKNMKGLQDCCNCIANIDCLTSLASLAEVENYVKPKINEGFDINITNARHPVVEKTLENKEFVPNNINLDNNNQLIIITGPNMAGKSVYIRQTALIILLAQMGSYVPAEKAKTGIVDKIFVRSGASDVITNNLSTFMVEMTETANILNNATKNSLIIMDEVGRGTSTYDGISIAKAVSEYLVNNNKGMHPKTLFATHYHELQELEKKYPGKIKNYHMAVKENNNNPIFLYKLVRGGATASFGIEVAKMAGVPKEVTKNAEKILQDLENKTSKEINNRLLIESEEWIEILKKLEIDSLTPLEALNKLSEVKEKMKDSQVKKNSLLKVRLNSHENS